MKRTHKILLIIGGVLSALAVDHTFSTRPLPFEEAAWKAGEQAKFDSSAPRLRMADGLIASGALKGQTKPNVLTMLGPPSQTDKFRDYNLVYWLGAERGSISIDSEWLVISFDKDQRVSEVLLVRD